ncbi:MAG: winged helix-turn-helix transcriptional regulator [Planctomycetes bacterium]|nr:winged helix-turn-helix transcriptional regulator [Planctomycetota bacterium]
MSPKPKDHPPMTDDMLGAVAERFRALSEPVRLRLMDTLCRGPRSVGELAQIAGQSHANTSKHLAVLADAGFVVRTPDGNRAVYALKDDTAERLCAVMCDRVVAIAEEDVRRLRPASAPPPPAASATRRKGSRADEA